jgi:hypothetical protein
MRHTEGGETGGRAALTVAAPAGAVAVVGAVVEED